MLLKKVISQFMLNTVDCLFSFHSLPMFPLQKAPILFRCLQVPPKPPATHENLVS